jgi:hypothetical protein
MVVGTSHSIGLRERAVALAEEGRELLRLKTAQLDVPSQGDLVTVPRDRGTVILNQSLSASGQKLAFIYRLWPLS